MRRILLSTGLVAGLALTPLPVGQAALAAPQAVVAAVKSAAKSDRELRAFYQARGNRPLWFEAGPDTPAARQLIELIATADLDGLDPEEYRAAALHDAVERASEGGAREVARADVMLSRAFAAYVRDTRRPVYDNTRYIDAELAPNPPSVREVLQAADAARSLDADEVDWEALAAGRLELPMRKLPGPDNAMGRVKFMLPNDLGIYLHDTPERELFGKAERRFSSGCVRVEDAQRLGKWLFGKTLKAQSDAPEQHVNLPRPVPVYITYLTAAPAGQSIAFRKDAYGRDDAQLARLRGPAFASASR